MSTGTLTTAIASLSDALAGLGMVHEVLPERITPPCTLLKPADPYVTTEGRPAQIGDLHYEVVLIVRPGANPDQERAAIGMAEDAIAALRKHTSAVAETVSAPYDLQIGQAVYLAIRINVTLLTRLTLD